VAQEATDDELEETVPSPLGAKRTVRPAYGGTGQECGRSECHPVTGRIGSDDPARKGADVHVVSRRERVWRTGLIGESK